MYSSVSVESVTGVTQDKLRTAVPIPSRHPDFRPQPPEGELARFPGFKLPTWPCHYSSPKNPRSSFHSSTSNCHFASRVKHFILSLKWLVFTCLYLCFAPRVLCPVLTLFLLSVSLRTVAGLSVCPPPPAAAASVLSESSSIHCLSLSVFSLSWLESILISFRGDSASERNDRGASMKGAGSLHRRSRRC